MPRLQCEFKKDQIAFRSIYNSLITEHYSSVAYCISCLIYFTPTKYDYRFKINPVNTFSVGSP